MDLIDVDARRDEWKDAGPPHSVAFPVMLQSWEWLTFLHWRYEPHAIARLLPAGVQLDTFDGAAWVGLAPFVLTRLRLPVMPAWPWLSRFPETNVRTYVRGPDGKPGVWFFTLEAARLAAVLGARAAYHLPYRWSSMSVSSRPDRVEYSSKRFLGKGATRVTIEPGERFTVEPFDNFLTARFRLITARGTRIGFADIAHPPWPWQRARVLELEEDLVENSGVPAPSGEPVVHFSRAIDVRIGRLHWF